jgi:hypothetical protein
MGKAFLLPLSVSLFRVTLLIPGMDFVWETGCKYLRLNFHDLSHFPYPFIIVFVSPCLKLGQFLGVLPLTARLTILGELIITPIWVSTLSPISTTLTETS